MTRTISGAAEVALAFIEKRHSDHWIPSFRPIDGKLKSVTKGTTVTIITRTDDHGLEILMSPYPTESVRRHILAARFAALIAGYAQVGTYIERVEEMDRRMAVYSNSTST